MWQAKWLILTIAVNVQGIEILNECCTGINIPIWPGKYKDITKATDNKGTERPIPPKIITQDEIKHFETAHPQEIDQRPPIQQTTTQYYFVPSRRPDTPKIEVLPPVNQVKPADNYWFENTPKPEKMWYEKTDTPQPPFEIVSQVVFKPSVKEPMKELAKHFIVRPTSTDFVNDRQPWKPETVTKQPIMVITIDPTETTTKVTTEYPFVKKPNTPKIEVLPPVNQIKPANDEWFENTPKPEKTNQVKPANDEWFENTPKPEKTNQVKPANDEKIRYETEDVPHAPYAIISQEVFRTLPKAWAKHFIVRPTSTNFVNDRQPWKPETVTNQPIMVITIDPTETTTKATTEYPFVKKPNTLKTEVLPPVNQIKPNDEWFENTPKPEKNYQVKSANDEWFENTPKPEKTNQVKPANDEWFENTPKPEKIRYETKDIPQAPYAIISQEVFKTLPKELAKYFIVRPTSKNVEYDRQPWKPETVTKQPIKVITIDPTETTTETTVITTETTTKATTENPFVKKRKYVLTPITVSKYPKVSKIQYISKPARFTTERNENERKQYILTPVSTTQQPILDKKQYIILRPIRRKQYGFTRNNRRNGERIKLFKLVPTVTPIPEKEKKEEREEEKEEKYTTVKPEPPEPTKSPWAV